VWSFRTGDGVESSPAVADGMVFVGSTDDRIYGFGNIIRVPEDYPTVQEAIDVASPGATILIAPGLYHEYLIVDKPLTIYGMKGSSADFDGGGSGIAVVLLPEASGTTITGITITNYEQGILINDADDCVIYNNMMTGNIIGINSTDYSTGNLIYANTISENEIGINMSGSNGNAIYHNSFINNDAQAVTSTSINAWDNGYPEGGNYWSTHISADSLNGPSQDQPGSDGILDTQYEVGPNNVDEYPLAKPFSFHDVGIASTASSKTVVGQGLALSIDTKILNYGLYSETFTISICLNSYVLATQTMTLTERNSTTVSFEIDTSTLAKGNYTIVAEATAVPSENDTTDNLLTDGWIIIAIIGDVTGPDGWPDGKCDMRDIGVVAKLFGKDHSDLEYDPNKDVVYDLKIDMRDIGTVAKRFGEIDP
ncbi:PQQ-binding-like beta-propeller repeat protein, partial [Candidatus Bathyarchaeota archaeon]|nr:PQQ-binding-like beta-propeller repeat protein [Candidatus Bathyarchaeota archaeon]